MRRAPETVCVAGRLRRAHLGQHDRGFFKKSTREFGHELLASGLLEL